ncbi:penicillin-binding protein 1A [Wenzhouxiangella marina]|uniref:penicillin-binding protein 1A n=1 Tax=Wenzhouxiangella marina TaxID=1579979 RepID=UPI0017FBAAED|nr:penicillin-binding protein 1A [Wenzhouxiangella marina]MBB6087472.1 penicillin-binding protein 1A [Wenzhouxiangella marina]
MPTLPSVDSLRDVRLQVPLRIYSADQELMLEVGEQRRLPLAIDEMPETLRQAFLAAEDDRFYSHPGIDWRGTARAVWLYGLSLGRGRVPGGSTITQQVARRFFLSTEYSVTRKLREMLLALKIERELSKDEIFELYLNKEFLGHRAYGVGAAAQVYYGKTVDELSLAEMAMLAALPKAPSRDNPLSGPERAMIRRNWVLDRMLELGYIDEAAHAQARAEPNNARYHGSVQELDASWVSEMTRQRVVDRLGAEEAYSGGYRVTTTIESRLQRAADRAVRDGLQAYDRRHGWRGVQQRIEEEALLEPGRIEERLAQIRPVADLVPAVVIESTPELATLRLDRGEIVTLGPEAVAWARPYIDVNTLGSAPESVDALLQAGDIVRLRQVDEQWQLAQVPEAQAALVSLDAETGAILALVGGLEFGRSQFNRVTQSRRQPGSSFKPFIYSAAFDHGFNPASLVNDAPVVVDDPSMERAWRPTNFSQRFHGPTRLREAMIHSRNLVSVRLLMSIGLAPIRNYLPRFGFEQDELPAGPSLALGSASLTPLSIARAYAVFANGGYSIEPEFIHRVETSEGEMVYEPSWTRICPDCPERLPAMTAIEESAEDTAETAGPRRIDLDEISETLEPPPLVGPVVPRAAEQVLSPQTTWLIRSMMSDVIRLGTGRRALALGRDDLAGKTGTTNDLRDTWFSGFGGGVVTTVWLGRDDNETLGSWEQGGRTALPLWVDFMAVALENRPEQLPEPPVGLVQALIDPDTGERVRPGFPGAMTEWFQADNLPPMRESEDLEQDLDPYDIY